VLARAFERSQGIVRPSRARHQVDALTTPRREGAIIRRSRRPEPQRGGGPQGKSTRSAPGRAPTRRRQGLLKRLFFDPKRYDLGRSVVVTELDLKIELENRHLDTPTSSPPQVSRPSQEERRYRDDIDSPCSRRVRTVGESSPTSAGVGLSRTERLVVSA